MQYRLLQRISGKGTGPDQFAESLRGIAVDAARVIYAVGDSDLKVFEPHGTLRRSWRTVQPSYCVAADADGSVFAGQPGQIEIYDQVGRLVETWKDAERLGLVTAIGFFGDDVLVADAAKRCIRRFDRRGRLLNDIGVNNKTGGFLIPNGVLDFGVDARGVVFAANPGKHRIERYNLAGELLGHFGRFGERNREDFPGCCNPTNVTVTPRGQIAATEKAAPRAKVYDVTGKLLALIDAEAFDRNCKNIDVAADSQGRIYVADTVRLQICVFAADETSTPSQSIPGCGAG